MAHFWLDAETRRCHDEWIDRASRRHAGRRHGGLVDEDIELLASLFGCTSRQLRIELAGRNVAAVAADRGVSSVIVFAAFFRRAMQRLDRAVESGIISAEFGREAVPRLAHRALWRVHTIHPPLRACRRGMVGPNQTFV
jgi:hypothetical protein